MQTGQGRQRPVADGSLAGSSRVEQQDVEIAMAKRPTHCCGGEPGSGIIADDDDVLDGAHRPASIGAAGQYLLRNASWLGMPAAALSMPSRIDCIARVSSAPSTASARGS